jgi:hypothetical protein
MEPGAVSPGVLALVAEDAPSRAILCAGAGSFERAYVTLTQGSFIGGGAEAPDRVAAQFERISDRSGEIVPENAFEQGRIEVENASRGA